MLDRAPAESPSAAPPWPPCTSASFSYASARSRWRAGSFADSFDNVPRYSSARLTRSSRAGVDPGRFRIESWNSKRKELASLRTSSKRRSARACSASAIRAWRAVARMPPTSATTRSAAAAAAARWRARNLPLRYVNVSRRAFTGAPSRWRRTSSASCSAEAYRRSGSLRSALRTMVSRSPSSRRLSLSPPPAPAAAALGLSGSVSSTAFATSPAGAAAAPNGRTPARSS